MSCVNNNINTYLKDATIKSLQYMNSHYSNIHSTPIYDYYKYSGDINDPFNTNFKTRYSNIIQTDFNIDYKEHSNLKYITLNTDDNSFVNCAVQTSVPWFTMTEDYKKCEVVKNIEYDQNRLKIEKIKDDTVITPVLSTKNKTAFCTYDNNVNKAYCENAWYDWMITPNYHLGNVYYKDNSRYTELDVYKCYKPCSGDYLPYVTEKGEIKCIPKKYFGSGIFNRKYMFNSVALINLIGNIACTNIYENNNTSTDYFRTNLLYILHRLIYEYEISNKVDTNIYTINDTIANKIRLIKIGENINYDNKQQNFLKIKSEYDEIYRNIKDVLENEVLKNYDSNINKDYSNLNEFTYKNGRFHEKEPEMFSYTGMETYGVLTPPILIHTWMLSQIFKPLDKDIFNYRDVFYGLNGNNAEGNNVTKIINETLYHKLTNIFKDKHKAIRLKNIFYKAITNCYDGKWTFSVNFISVTKKALNNSELLKIINDNYLYYFTNNINFCKSSDNIPVPQLTASIPTENPGSIVSKYAINTYLSDNINPLSIDKSDSSRIKDNFKKLLICDDSKIEKLLFSLKYYKDTDIVILYSELLKNIREKSNTSNGIDRVSYTFSLNYFEPKVDYSIPTYNIDIPTNLYCHYLFSMEELETKSCPPDHIYNPTIKECEFIPTPPPPPPEEKSLIEDADINIPELNNIMRIFFQIIIVAIVLYLIYIIYDLFGEFILSTINYILVNFNHFKQYVTFKLMDLLGGPDNSDKLDIESNKLNSRIELTQSELENILVKDKLATDYNKEVEYRENQKVKAKILRK